MRAFRLFTSKTGVLPGASGAWNTALHEIGRIAPSAFVAILDDDDMWEPDYLERCEKEAQARNLDMVAAGIVYNHSGEQDSVSAEKPRGPQRKRPAGSQPLHTGIQPFRETIQNA